MITKTTKSTGSSSGLKVQLTLERHRFELHGSTYTVSLQENDQRRERREGHMFKMIL